MGKRANTKEPAPPSRRRWPLQDAKARFSDVVRLARESGPQRITLRGQDAVVIVAAETWDKERAHRSGRRLVDALAGSPLAGIDFDRPAVDGPVRAVDL